MPQREIPVRARDIQHALRRVLGRERLIGRRRHHLLQLQEINVIPQPVFRDLPPDALLEFPHRPFRRDADLPWLGKMDVIRRPRLDELHRRRFRRVL